MHQNSRRLTKSSPYLAIAISPLLRKNCFCRCDLWLVLSIRVKHLLCLRSNENVSKFELLANLLNFFFQLLDFRGITENQYPKIIYISWPCFAKFAWLFLLNLNLNLPNLFRYFFTKLVSKCSVPKYQKHFCCWNAVFSSENW